MLDGDVLAQLTIPTPLQDHLLEAAWPLLSVESKLQLINAVARSNSDSISECLSRLGLTDGAAIVRFWAARFTHFRRPSPNEETEELFPVTAEEAQLAARADSDTSALVRAAATGTGSGSAMWLKELPHLARLLVLRNYQHEQNQMLADFLKEGLANGDPPIGELRDCILEYSMSEAFRVMFDDIDDNGWGEHSKRSGMESLWQLAASAPPEIRTPLAELLPLAGRYWKLDQKFIDQLPEAVLSRVLWRDGESIDALRTKVRANPALYPSALVQQVEKFNEMQAEYGGADEDDLKVKRAREAPDRELVLLNLVLDLMGQLRELKEELASARESVSEKRGWFS